MNPGRPPKSRTELPFFSRQELDLNSEERGNLTKPPPNRYGSSSSISLFVVRGSGRRKSLCGTNSPCSLSSVGFSKGVLLGCWRCPSV